MSQQGSASSNAVRLVALLPDAPKVRAGHGMLLATSYVLADMLTSTLVLAPRHTTFRARSGAKTGPVKEAALHKHLASFLV